MSWILENVGHLAAYTPAILAAFLILAVLAAWLFRHDSSVLGQSPKLKKAAYKIAVSILPLPLIALAVAFGPMLPLTRSARRLASNTGKTMPDVIFRTVADNQERRLSDFRGRVVVVNIWATWCGPCRQELPTLNLLQRRYGSRGVTVITLSDEKPERILSFLHERAPDTLNGYVTGFEWLPVKTFRPFTLIIGRNGKLQDYFFGAQQFAAFESRIRSQL